MDRYNAWGYIEFEDIPLDGTIRPYGLKLEGHKLPLHRLLEFNPEWPPLFIDLFIFRVTGNEVGLFPRPEKGFLFDEKGL